MPSIYYTRSTFSPARSSSRFSMADVFRRAFASVDQQLRNFRTETATKEVRNLHGVLWFREPYLNALHLLHPIHFQPGALLIQVQHGGARIDDHLFAAQDFGDRHPENLDIQQETFIPDVPDVLAETVIPACLIPAVHLRPAGDSRTDLEPDALLFGVEGQVPHEERPWAYQAHIAAKHVPEFGKLIRRRNLPTQPNRS